MTALAKNTGGIVDSIARSWDRDRLPIIFLVALFVGVVIVVWGAVFSPGYRLAAALIWGLGFCVSGILLGFLFAIPRTLPSGTANISSSNNISNGNAPKPYKVVSVQGESDSKKGADAIDTGAEPVTLPKQASGGVSRNEINSNLVEVSDWLTKIIVGVGLVELKSLPSGAESVAKFMAGSLGIDPMPGTAIAGGIMLFFSVLGFLIGYLLTRIYLSILMTRADAQIMTSDVLRLESGKEVDIAELTRLQQSSIDDLQETVAQLVLATPQNAAAATSAASSLTSTSRAATRLLWVDDNPHNNMLLVEQLNRDGVVVDQVLTTQQAIDAMARTQYGAVITDMARNEGNRDVQNAGVLFVRKAKELNPDLQIVVYCSRRMATLFGGEAEAAGVRLVTTSGTALLGVVSRILRAAGESTGDSKDR